MIFAANVVEGIALLFSFAALLIAARAVQLVHRRTHPAPSTPASTRPEPATPARRATTSPAQSATQQTSNGNGQPRGNQLRDQVRAFLADHAGSDFSLVQLSKAVDRRSATVSYAVTKLVEAGEVELTSPKPRRYAITPTGTQAAQQHPTALPVQPTEPDTAQATTEPTATPEPAPTPATPQTSNGNGNGQPRGNELRDQVRAYLAEHEGSDFSLVQVSKAVDRRTATVSYALGKLTDSGDVELTSPKPRRYAITPTGAQAHNRQPATADTAQQALPAIAEPDQDTTSAEPVTGPLPTPATAAQPAADSSSQTPAGQLRDRVRGFLAEHPGADFSLLEIAQELGKPSATVNYAVTKLVDTGALTVTSTTPRRRYTLAPGTPASSAQPQPATSPDQAEQTPAEDTPARQPRARRAARAPQATATVTALDPNDRKARTSTKPRGQRRR